MLNIYYWFKEAEAKGKLVKTSIIETANQLKILNSIERNITCKSGTPEAVARFIKEILHFNNTYKISNALLYGYICKSEKLGLKQFYAWKSTEPEIYPRTVNGLFRWLYATIVREQVVNHFRKNILSVKQGNMRLRIFIHEIKAKKKLFESELEIAQQFITDLAVNPITEQELYTYLLYSAFNPYDMTQMRSLHDIKVRDFTSLMKAAEIVAERFQPHFVVV